LSPRDVKNLAASVQRRLLNLARERGEDSYGLLTRFALERLTFRLAASEHGDRFVLKGAMLFAVWGGQPHRPTRDLDLLGSGTSDVPALMSVFRDVCRVEVEPDGLRFLPETVAGQVIREDDVYEGVRVTLRAMMGKARIPLQVDVGFGDAVYPDPEPVEIPALLEFPAPRLLAYPRESVVSEKLQAMTVLGIANSRMKDFYDIWALARGFAFEGAVLAQAIRRTFERRGTAVPARALSLLTTRLPTRSGGCDARTRLRSEPPAARLPRSCSPSLGCSSPSWSSWSRSSAASRGHGRNSF